MKRNRMKVKGFLLKIKWVWQCRRVHQYFWYFTFGWILLSTISRFQSPDQANIDTLVGRLGRRRKSQFSCIHFPPLLFLDGEKGADWRANILKHSRASANMYKQYICIPHVPCSVWQLITMPKTMREVSREKSSGCFFNFTCESVWYAPREGVQVQNVFPSRRG